MSEFSLTSDSRRTFKWRESATCPPMSGSGGLMVWADITLDDHTLLHVFERGHVAAMSLGALCSSFHGRNWFIKQMTTRGHLELISSINFWKVRIFAGWIGLSDLLTSSL
ncbi:hypothetical protein TNCV_2018071 [Trichonephila clavipes]|nr:hypothetical protein TNCV_2018071 [Trichonephila clavipes]